MPQVDHVTFLPQIFWLVVLFIFFYVTILRDVLLSVNSVLKSRLNMTLSNNQKENLFSDESIQTFVLSSNFFFSTFNLTKTFLFSKVFHVKSWLNLKYSTNHVISAAEKQINLKYSLNCQKSLLENI